MVDTAELTAVLDSRDAGNAASAYQVIAVWEQTVADALEQGGGATYRDVFWEHIEDVTDRLLSEAISMSGVNWEFVEELIETYPADGTGQPELPGVDIDGSLTSAAVTNTVGAAVVLERVENGAAGLPEAGFEYLHDSARFAADVAWEDASCIGWYLGHPEIDVEDRLVTLSQEYGQEVFVPCALEPGFVADEEASLSLLETLFDQQLIDPGPDLFHIDSAYRGRGDFAPRYTPNWVTTKMDRGMSDETVENILQILHEHLQYEFLEHMKHESQIKFPLTRAPEE